MISKATVATAKKNKNVSFTVTAHKCSLISKWHWDILISTVLLCDELSEDLEFELRSLYTDTMKLRKRIFLSVARQPVNMLLIFISTTTAPISSNPLWIPHNTPPVQQSRCRMAAPITLPHISDSARLPSSNQVSPELLKRTHHSDINVVLTVVLMCQMSSSVAKPLLWDCKRDRRVQVIIPLPNDENCKNHFVNNFYMLKCN